MHSRSWFPKTAPELCQASPDPLAPSPLEPSPHETSPREPTAFVDFQRAIPV